MRHIVRPVLACFFVAVFAGRAGADNNDFTLYRFHEGIERGEGDCDASPNCVLLVNADNGLFKKFATDFGMVMSPKFLAPAETLGQAGFDVGFEASFSAIDPTQEHWQKASPVEGQAPSDVLTTMQIHVRKGLPFSFELGGTLTKLMDSEMFALGGELKWAFNEGFYYLPDIAVRVGANRLLGSRDLDMLTGGLDVSISHPFGIGGLLSLTPYAGWNLLFINASSHVLDATPGLPGFMPPYCEGDGTDTRLEDPITHAKSPSPECQKAAQAAQTTDYRANFVLSRQSWDKMSFHRGFFGLRLKVTVVSLVAEAVLAEAVNTYSVRLGLDF